MRARAWIASLAAVLVTACATLEPAYRPPAPPIPAAWPAGPGYPPAGAGVVAPVGWREVFVDPKLQAVIELALANNRDLRVAAANIEAAQAQHRVQRAELFPSLDAQAEAAYGRSVAAAPTSAIDLHDYTASIGVSAYELDLFGRVRSLSKAALEQYLASQEARRAVQISLVAEVAADWLTLDADRALLKIARDTQVSGEASLGLVKRRFQGGITSALDVSQAQTVVQQARADVARYTTQIAQDINALTLAVGAAAPDALLPEGTGAPLAVADPPVGVSSEVLLRRPDVLQAEDQLKAANADIGAARAAFFPSVSLTGAGGASSTALSSLFTAGSGIWSFAPSVTLPIFAGGRNRAALDYAKAQRNAQVAQYEKAVQTAFRETADALAQRGGVDERLAAEQALTDAATTELRLSTARYQRGSDSYLNTLIAQRAVYSAEQDLVAARLARSASMVALYKALGGGFR